jgi:hypothetical protein
MATRYNINSTVQRVVAGVLEPGSGASALVTDPSSNPITVYAAETGAGQVSNPIATTSFGRIEGWVEVPDFNITVSGSGITTYTEYIRKSPQGTVSLAGSTAINWGTGWGVSDTNLYRSAASVLKTDDTFNAVLDQNSRVDSATRVLTGDVAGKAGIAFGTSLDTNLYRDAANALKSDDSLEVTGGVQAGLWSGKAAFWSAMSSGNRTFGNWLIAGDTNPSFEIQGSGLHRWGPGGGTGVDTTLYRSGASALTTDGAFVVGTSVNIGTTATIGGALDHNGTTVGFFAVAPTTRATATADIKDALALYGLLTNGGASPLNLDGGALTAGTINGTAYQVSGTALASTHLSDSADLVRVGGGQTSSSLTVTGNTRLGDADTDTVGFFSSAGTVRASSTADIKDALTAYGLLQGTSATPLNLDGGALTAGAVSGTTGTFSGAVSGTSGTFSADLNLSGALNHDGTTVGFYTRTPVVINATPFTNAASGVNATTYALGSSYTMDQLASFVMTMLKHLGDVNGVGLLNTTSI